MLLTNGKIYRSAHDMAPAEAVLVKDRCVSWIGAAADAPDEQMVIDLGGRVAVPALSDPHIHLFMLAIAKFQMSFAKHPPQNFAEIITLLKALDPLEQPGGWLQGCNLMETRLAEARLPTRADLDQAFPDRPVMLRRYCGHEAVLNSAALRALDLAKDTPDPAGGTFGRDGQGHLNGVAKEAAADWIFARAPIPSKTQLAECILSIMHDCLALGLVSLTEAAVGFSAGHTREAAVWDYLRRSCVVPVRMSFMTRLDPHDAAALGLVPLNDRNWCMDTLKFFADGIIGGRSGAVSVPYEDTGGFGEMMHPPGVLEALFDQAHADGWRIAVHATGDLGIARTLDAISGAQGKTRDRRHRIEHCFVPSDHAFGMLAEQAISVVTQPGFLGRMGCSIADGLGAARAARSYPAASVLRAGGRLAFSSDAPTGPFSPWQGIADAVTRVGDHGGKIGADEALDIRDALDAYIGGSAHVMGHETFRSTLSPGLAGDIAVLDHDPFVAAPEDLPHIRAVLTLKDGNIVFDARD